MKNNFLYSYKDCWNYSLTISNYRKIKKLKNDIISICEVSPEEFWLNFSLKKLTNLEYKKNCSNLKKYLLKFYPVPYLINKVYFFGLFFEIKKGIFIPQKDTELLLEKTLEISQYNWKKNNKKLNVLELGTGCGNISISLANKKKNWKFIATDIDNKSLNIAKKNSLIYNLKNIDFLNSNLFNNIILDNEKIDILISNPPYINEKDYENLNISTKFQPKKALLSKNKGYYFFEEIISKSSLFFSEKFLLIMEIGNNQDKKVIKLLSRYFPEAKVSFFRNYNNKIRIVYAFK